MVALLSPITSALVTWYARKKDTGMMWWLQEFVSRIGEIIWSLWFWTFAVLVGMNNAFILLWIAFIVLSWYLFTKKMINRKNKDYEAIKEKLAKIPFFDK
jgi:energy-converting hydrogenase Eha subunit F